MKLLRNIIITILCTLFLCGCHDMEPIENLAVIIGFGYDIEKKENTKEEKLVSSIEYISIKKKEEAGTDYFNGKSKSIYTSLEDYKVKQGKPFRYGSELIYLISEERAKYGIDDIIFDLVSYPSVNINAKVLICKDKCKDYFSLKPDSGSTSEHLSDMVKFANEEYFYSNYYTVNDLLCMYYQKGRVLYLPYIEIINENPKLSGVAIFKKNKLYKIVPNKEAKLINVLRNSDNNGIITIHSKKPLEYLEMEGKSKVKVKVSKNKERLKYDIKVDIIGDLRIDTIDEKEFDKKYIKELEKKFANKLKKDLNKEIKKIQKEYDVDCLDITKYALAEFGQDSKYNDIKYFSSADINLDVKVKIESTGKIQSSTE